MYLTTLPSWPGLPRNLKVANIVKRNGYKNEIKWSPKGKCFDLSPLIYKEMYILYEDQSGEFVCGYWDLKG